MYLHFIVHVFQRHILYSNESKRKLEYQLENAVILVSGTLVVVLISGSIDRRFETLSVRATNLMNSQPRWTQSYRSIIPDLQKPEIYPLCNSPSMYSFDGKRQSSIVEFSKGDLLGYSLTERTWKSNLLDRMFCRAPCVLKQNKD